jgi:hypothetical protein
VSNSGYACLSAASLHSRRHKPRIAGQSAQQTATRGALSFAYFSLGTQRKVSRQQAKPLLEKNRLTLITTESRLSPKGESRSDAQHPLTLPGRPHPCLLPEGEGEEGGLCATTETLNIFLYVEDFYPEPSEEHPKTLNLPFLLLTFVWARKEKSVASW